MNGWWNWQINQQIIEDQMNSIPRAKKYIVMWRIVCLDGVVWELESIGSDYRRWRRPTPLWFWS